jgi:hypothetical protein
MHILIPIVAFIAFLAFAPQAAMKFAVWFAVTAFVVRESARRIAGADVGFGAAATSVVYAAVLPLLALMALGGLTGPAGSMTIGGPAILALALLATSFVGAFMIGLKTDLKASAIIAVIAVATSVTLALLIRAVA